jgi:hypothetical protein
VNTRTLAGAAVALATLAALGVAVLSSMLHALEETLTSTDKIPWDDESWD